jgi:hypothetical protein
MLGGDGDLAMATWVVGDIHGCAEELASLVERLDLGPADRLVAVGDLFHRGPDPAGAMRILRRLGAAFVLGNHELAVLRRVGVAPASLAREDRPPLRETFPPLDDEDLAGDGRSRCDVAPEHRAELLVFLQRHSGFLLRRASIEGARATPDGRDWAVVHAGVAPGVPLEKNAIRDLTSLRRLTSRGRPWWYEEHAGPELILFGHTPSEQPRVHARRGRVLAIGLDTGCVYGGRLTAYSPELDEFRSVAAARAYATA